MTKHSSSFQHFLNEGIYIQRTHVDFQESQSKHVYHANKSSMTSIPKRQNCNLIVTQLKLRYDQIFEDYSAGFKALPTVFKLKHNQTHKTQRNQGFRQ